MDPSNMQWAANFGFAAVVAIYVLSRIEPALQRSTEKMMAAFNRESEKTAECIAEMSRTMTLLTIVLAKANGLDYDEIRKRYVDGSDIL